MINGQINDWVKYNVKLEKIYIELIIIKGYQILMKDWQCIWLSYTRGNSFHRQQIRTKKWFLKISEKGHQALNDQHS